MLLAEQPVHQRFVRPGPLVLGSNLLKSPTPTADRDRTVSRRSEPRSRTALMGEQPNPWDLLQPQDATIRHRGAKPPRRCGVLQSLAAQTIPSSLSRWWRVMDAINLRFRAGTSISRIKREVVTGRACIAYSAYAELSSHETRCVSAASSLPSVLPLVKGSTDMSHCSSPDHSSEEPYLTLGGDKPVIPRVAFIR